MFGTLRYALLPVVLFCIVIVVASFDTFSENIARKSTWHRTDVTVTGSEDFGQEVAKFRHTPNSFPDPHGRVSYVVDGTTYEWQGRGRDIGLTVMDPGEKIQVYYNPKNPREINTLVLLGASTGLFILASALAFLVFYIWFFWWRRPFRGRGSGDF
jgi:hypothetical protein